jgi:hypothetical protein
VLQFSSDGRSSPRDLQIDLLGRGWHGIPIKRTIDRLAHLLKPPASPAKLALASDLWRVGHCSFEAQFHLSFYGLHCFSNSLAGPGGQRLSTLCSPIEISPRRGMQNAFCIARVMLVEVSWSGYAAEVKFRCKARLALQLSILLLLSWSWLCRAEPNVIRLRNALISTDKPLSPKLAAPAMAGPSPTGGLFLIQLRDHLRPAWRQELHRLGIDVIGFVPDDAFVVRLNQGSMTQVRALSFVRWVGAYRPEFRIAPDLLQSIRPGPLGSLLGVKVLVSRSASSTELGDIEARFRTLDSKSTFSFGLILRGLISANQLTNIACSESVLWIEPIHQMKLLDEISSKIVGGGTVLSVQGTSDHPLPAQSTPGTFGTTNSIHATLTQQLGYDGRGVVVAVADSGLNNGDAETMHPDLWGRVDGFFFYGSLQNAADQVGHGTHVAGIIAGDAATGETDNNDALYGLGIAPKAHLVAQRVFDAAGQDQLPEYDVLTSDAVRAGAVIGSNSWGNDVQGRYDLSSAEFDALVRDADPQSAGEQPITLAFSAGNAGPGRQTIDSPASAKNVIAIGASQNDRFDLGTYTDGDRAMADFSSRGPCEDGRLKPDLVAPGTWIASLQSAAAGSDNAWAAISGNYQYEGGTSQAVPHVAGAAAVFIQFYRETHGQTNPSPALIKAALINSATPLQTSSSIAAVPGPDQGWGRVALTNLISSARQVQYVDQTALLSTGQTFEQHIIVAGAQGPLKITMAYTDVPGLPAALPALVNDLDLEVIAPDGSLYLGNQFANGESVQGATSSDNVNNVEAVVLAQPGAGDYLVRVRARNVVEDVHQPDSDTPEQDFALVISGDLAPPGLGILTLDRAAYTAPSIISLKLIDSDLIGQPSAQVTVNSSSQSTGITVSLYPSSVSGMFTGSVATVTGPAPTHGALLIKNGDMIEAVYQDASPAGIRTATAQADLIPPVLTNLSVTNRFGKEVITWQTDKPATTAVQFGTNLAQLAWTTNSFFSTEHEIDLQGLAPGATYQFSIVSTDAAGNSTLADNGGQFYHFVPVAIPSVLLVNAFVPDDPIAATTPVPLTSYTDALDASGFTYQIWDLTQPNAPSPTVSDLSAFRAVIWRISDSFASQTTLNSDQQAAVTAYLAGGGSLMLASMEVLSRLGPVPFRTNVLQVESFATNSAHSLAQCSTCDEDHGVEAIVGAQHDLIGDGVQAPLSYTNYDSPVLDAVNIPTDMSDTFGPTAAAVPILYDAASGRVVGIRYPKTGRDTPGRVVFLSFPFDALPSANRNDLMRKILLFLAPDAADVPTLSLDRTAYTLPELVTVEVTDAQAAAEDQVNVQFFTSVVTNGVPLTLLETSRPGVFRGFITLVSATDLPGPERVPVQTNGTIWVEYTGGAHPQTVSAQADIDVSSPQISNIQIQPAYTQISIQWTTSEPADALVQFGESSFLGRTAYDPEPSTQHVLTLQGLKPDRLYFYQIVSRDNAGNTAVDDNRGKFYSIRTLRPVFAPWSDSLEGITTNWTVQADPQSDVSWTVGTPNNGRETQAHSPTHAWGSNLQGTPISVAQTTLLSPAVDLPPANYATLRFWQSYDFQSDPSFEAGKLLILTNNAQTDPILLDDIQGASDGWQEAVYDLSQFTGQIVQLVWSYEFAASDLPENRPGWLLDDFSITITNSLHGFIQITNNLAEATFSLLGPINRNGEGTSAIYTNAPQGQYIVQFGDVPFYQTPAPQTNILTDGPLVFQGVYTYDDVNHNGISDAWEEQYFGSVADSHPGNLDSDGDGASDYAEFIAGTDPTDPTSFLQLSPPTWLANGMLRLSWVAVPGHAYRLLTSPNATSWTPLSGWIRAVSPQLSYTTAGASGPDPVFYQLEVIP